MSVEKEYESPVDYLKSDNIQYRTDESINNSPSERNSPTIHERPIIQNLGVLQSIPAKEPLP